MRPTTTRSRVLLAGALTLLTAALISTRNVDSGSSEAPPSALDIVLAAPSSPKSEIARLQNEIEGAADPTAPLERLGFAFLAESRRTGDAGLQGLAELCGRAFLEANGDECSARFLIGLALHQKHDFAAAEREARHVVDRRGAPFDHGLLGDVLLDRGDLDGAALAYQAMLDARPDARGYARAAELRYRRGDVEGALSAIDMACAASSRRDPEGFAWIHARRAALELHAGRLDAAERSCDVALDVAPSSAESLLALGRVRLARGENDAAVEPLARAASRLGTPSALELLHEALRASSRQSEAEAVARRLLDEGADSDPRGLSLFLSRTGQDPRRAQALARTELASRRDARTLGACAWASYRLGELVAAREFVDEALATGLEDAGLFLIAGLVHEALATEEAEPCLEQARRLRHALLPSERARLEGV